MRGFKRRPRLNFKEYNFKDLFCIRDCIKELFNLGLKNKYLERVQKTISKELERRKLNDI